MCQTLTHPHIVGLLDILEIDNSSFATILDLCEGPDLDAVLREHGVKGVEKWEGVIRRGTGGSLAWTQCCGGAGCVGDAGEVEESWKGGGKGGE